MLPLSATIMAGGVGSRFWPLSTDERPKQFLSLDGKRSLLQWSFDRLKPLFPADQITVLTNQRYVSLVQEQLPELPSENIVGEPMRRDTAAAVALAALLAEHRFGSSLMAIVTADHFIDTNQQFEQAIQSALEAAEAHEALFTFGIRPSYPATGYGYLELSDQVDERRQLPHYRLKRFREKPGIDLAEHFLEKGGYLWNSGMFVWRTDVILAEFERLLPAHLERLRPVMAHHANPDWNLALERGFEGLEKISVDYAILEKAREVRAVVPEFEWNDLGGWRAIDSFLEAVGSGNLIRGDVTFEQAGNNLVFCQDPSETVGLLGVDNLVVVRAGRRTLVMHKGMAEQLKNLVARL